MKSILVATDFSRVANHAAHRAVLLARASGSARVELLHVLPHLGRWARWLGPSAEAADRFEHARLQMEELLPALRSGSPVAIEGRLVSGKRIEALADAAKGADLVVVGAPGGWLRNLMLASTVHRLLRRTRRPLLMVGQRPVSQYRRVLVAVDLVTSPAMALASARDLAPQARFDVMHVYQAPFEGKLQYAGVSESVIETHRADAFRAAVARMADLALAQTTLPGLRAHVVHGSAAVEVPDKQRDLDADLVVVSRSAKTLAEEWLVQGVTSRLLEEGAGDVLVVPV
jgi:nucleotide-binding universal stress UspA family protein